MVDTYGLDRARELLFPKLRGTPEFPSDATSGRGVLQPYDNDLAYHCQLVRAAIEQYRDEAITPPPYYARRIAIILRKAKAYQLEASFLAQCVKFYGDPAFAERRAKALALAAKRRE